MTLPVINTPTYELVVPSSGETIEYRPWLVKEERILRLAMETEGERSLIKAMSTIIDACTFNSLNVNDMPIYDVEFIFIKIRGKSVGDEINLKVKCKECDEVNDLDVDSSTVEISKGENVEYKFNLTGDLWLEMRYPSFRDTAQLTDANDPYNLISSCMVKLYDNDKIYDFADESKESVDAFINSLSREQFSKIEKFMESIPMVKKDISYTCRSCGTNHNEVIRGATNFLG